MPKFFSPAVVAAVVTLLAGTTGYCAYNVGAPPVTTLPPPMPPPTRLLPDAVVPYPLEDLATGDAPD